MVLLNNQIFTFHDLFTFTESIDKHCSTYYNKLLYLWGRGILLVNFADFLFIVHAILLFHMHP